MNLVGSLFPSIPSKSPVERANDLLKIAVPADLRGEVPSGLRGRRVGVDQFSKLPVDTQLEILRRLPDDKQSQIISSSS